MAPTIVAVYKGGILIGSGSSKNSGIILENRSVDPILKVDEKFVLFSNGVSTIPQLMRDSLKGSIITANKTDKVKLCLRNVAQLLKYNLGKYNINNRLNFIIAGYDKWNGPQIYAIISGGSLIRAQYMVLGNNVDQTNCFCDINYNSRMNFEECYNFICRAISISLYRDQCSKGALRLCHVSNDGIFRKKILPRNNPTQKKIFLLADEIVV